MLCAICNISSGNCSEDCSFCTQSAYNDSKIETFRKKPLEQILKEARMAKKNKALGFCLVTSGKGMNDRKLDFVCEATKMIKKELDLMVIACNGIANFEQLKELKKIGVDSYNHNIETSREFYNKICSTHDWDERFETCQMAKEAGLMLCCGGIFGLGESKEDRKEYIKALQDLQPFSSPINFFLPHEALKIPAYDMSENEAVNIIKNVKSALPNTKVMIAAGREQVFAKNPKAMFEAGVDAIVTGNYLTAKGDEPCKDLRLLDSLNLQVQSECHG